MLDFNYSNSDLLNENIEKLIVGFTKNKYILYIFKTEMVIISNIQFHK